MAAVELTAEKVKQGRAIYQDVESCEIHYPGLKNILIKHFNPSKETYRAELKEFFRAHPKAAEVYRLWKEDAASPVVGMPLSEWVALSEGERAEFRAMGLHTVEQIAAASDITCQQMGMKGRETRTRAQALLATAKETAVAQQYAVENMKLREDLEQLRALVEQRGVSQVPAKGKPNKKKEEGQNEGN
jgi:hypothetical protein